MCYISKERSASANVGSGPKERLVRELTSVGTTNVATARIVAMWEGDTLDKASTAGSCARYWIVHGLTDVHLAIEQSWDGNGHARAVLTNGQISGGSNSVGCDGPEKSLLHGGV